MSASIQMAPGVFRFPTASHFINTVAFLEDDGSVTLVDCGTKFAPKRIVQGLASIGRHPRDVQRIVLTHAHNDHAGGAADMIRRTEVAGVDVHVDDAHYVETGSAPPMDRTTVGGKVFQRINYGGFAATPVANQLVDGQIIDVAGGLTVHHTPGHSPGHIALRHERTNVLITGDSIWNMASRMSWPTAAFCSSHKLNQQTAHVLGELDYDIAAFTHGPHINTNARETIRGFLRRKDAW